MSGMGIGVLGMMLRWGSDDGVTGESQE